MSGSLVTFDYAVWSARYPELAISVSAPLATSYFQEACLFVDNSVSSLLKASVPALTLILNMITAHIAQLNAPSAPGQPSSQLVGRISNASEGSVSVTTEMGPPSLSAAWFNQTKYGAEAWQALAPWRTARYLPGPQRYLGPGGYGYPGRWSLG